MLLDSNIMNVIYSTIHTIHRDQFYSATFFQPATYLGSLIAKVRYRLAALYTHASFAPSPARIQSLRADMEIISLSSDEIAHSSPVAPIWNDHNDTVIDTQYELEKKDKGKGKGIRYEVAMYKSCLSGLIYMI